MEGISPFVAVALALLFLLMLLMFFFLLRSISRLNDSIAEFRHLPLRSDGIMGRMSIKDLEISIHHLSNTLSCWRKESVSQNVNSPTTSKTEISLVNIDELKGLSESLDLFTKGIKDLSAFTTGVQELNRNLLEHQQRTEALITIADFYKKQMTDIETRQDAIRASVVKIDDQMQSALKMFEENSQKGLNQLQQTFLHQIDIMEKTSQSSMLEEKLQYMDAALKAVAMLEPLERTISTLNDHIRLFIPTNDNHTHNIYRENVKVYSGEIEKEEKEIKRKILDDLDDQIKKSSNMIEELKRKIDNLTSEKSRRNEEFVTLSKRILFGAEIRFVHERGEIYYQYKGDKDRRRLPLENFSSSPIALGFKTPEGKNIRIELTDELKESLNCRNRLVQDLNWAKQSLDIAQSQQNILCRRKSTLQAELNEIERIERLLHTFEHGYSSTLTCADDSMSPTIGIGDTVTLRPQKEGYYENDIVYVRLLNCYRLRRVVRLLGGGELEVQGDANEHPEYIVMADIIGKVIKIEKKKSDKGVPVNKK